MSLSIGLGVSSPGRRRLSQFIVPSSLLSDEAFVRQPPAILFYSIFFCPLSGRHPSARFMR